jgi:ribonuclease HI
MNASHAISDTKGKLPMSSDTANISAVSSVVSRWIAPGVGFLKANVDAGWDSITKKGGIGVIVRDHRGGIVSSAWRFLPRCTSAEEAEVTACVEGPNSLIQLQCTSAVVETDCSRVVEVMNSKRMDRSASWFQYAEGQELLNLDQDFSVSKVGRFCNRVAHGLAMLGKRGSSSLLSGSAPVEVLDLIKEECSFSGAFSSRT